jgi:hypothetical protein
MVRKVLGTLAVSDFTAVSRCAPAIIAGNANPVVPMAVKK